MQQVPTGPSFHMPQSAEVNPNPLPSPSLPPPICFVNKFVCKVQESFKDPWGYTGLNWIIQPHLPVLTAPTMLSPLCPVTYNIHSFQRLVRDIFGALILPSLPPLKMPSPPTGGSCSCCFCKALPGTKCRSFSHCLAFSLLSAERSALFPRKFGLQGFPLWLSAKEPD